MYEVSGGEQHALQLTLQWEGQFMLPIGAHDAKNGTKKMNCLEAMMLSSGFLTGAQKV